MAKYRNTWRIETTRLQHWDYGWNGNYFITICTPERECFFGTIENHTMHLSETGILAQHFWNKIPEHFPFVMLDAFVVMPNHVHGIVIINKQDGVGNGNNGGNAHGNVNAHGNGNGNVETRHCLVSTAKSAPSSPGQRRFQNQGKNTLSSIIGSYKSIVTRHARKINPNFGWQSRFYDHIIRDDQTLQRIKKYIHDNPKKWKSDRFY